MKFSFILRTVLAIVLLSLVFLMAVFSRLQSVDSEIRIEKDIKSFEAESPRPVVVYTEGTASQVSLEPVKSLTEFLNLSSPKPHLPSAKPSPVDKEISFTSDVENKMFPFTDSGKTWSDPFCEEFFSNQFSVKLAPCVDNTDRVVCYGSPFDDKMGSCFLNGLAMDTSRFYQTMFDNKDGVRDSKSLWFVSKNKICPNPDFDLMERKMVGGDYVKRLAQTAIITSPQEKCSKWINGTTFIFMGFDDHIYFKYLSWFSLHNGILNYEASTGNKPSLIIRIPELKGTFTHEDYEQKLFPEAKLMSLKDFSTQNHGTVCFEKVIVTPWAYSTNAFRCKMADSARRLRNRCYGCKGIGLPGTRFMSFRRRALAACSIDEATGIHRKGINDIVLQVRKAYIRRLNDDLKKFSRVMENPDEVMKGLQTAFPDAAVHIMVAEEMALCDQLRLIHNTDVLIGVHGAGLVHTWWLQDHALLFEIVPSRQKSNPSFKMLSSLTGRRYYGYEKLRGSEKRITLDVQDIVQELKKHF